MSKFFRVWFSEKYLFYTNVILSTTLSGVADVLAQECEAIAKSETPFHYWKWDPVRTQNMSIYGTFMGVFGHHWYYYLDRFYPGYTMNIILKKTLLDQIFCSPICIAGLFITVGFLEGVTEQEIIAEMKNKFWIIYAADWAIWPPAQIINFYFLPTRYRVLYGNAISLAYDVYLSYIKYK